MTASTLTSKGQITLPKSVRERLRLDTGARVEFVETDAGFLLRAATQDIRALRGILKRPKMRPVSIDAMNEAIAAMGLRKP
jgi:antitoxin PrlF